MKAKDQWIRDTENSIENIGRAEPNPYLYDKILQRLQKGAVTRTFSHIIQPKTMWRVAACVALLFILNVVAVIHYSKSSYVASPKNTINPVANEYFSFMNTPQF